MRFVIYCRKSTDTEEKQVLSLESQEQELLKLANRDNLDVVEIFRESMSAKEPGRPVFNKILSMVSKGKIDAILCWKIDRLTRNPIDGGQIQWMLQTEKIKCIRTFEKNYYPSDNVMLINIEQAMATQYIRDLSTNVKRGNRAKLERGEWPSPAPMGYVNDKGTKTVKVDKKMAPYVIRAFRLYATGGYTLKDITNVLYEEGLRTRTGKKICKNQVHHFITNKFYYGVMERGGKTYQGIHKPLVNFSLFTEANNVLHGRNHPRPKKHFYTARGFLKCASCGCALTGDTKKGFIYYYCTNGKGECTQHRKYLRSEIVDRLISEVLLKLKFDKRIIELSAKAYSEKNYTNDSHVASILQRLTNEAKLLVEKELILVDGLSSRIIREEVYIAKMKELESRQQDIIQQIREIESKWKGSEVTLEQIKNVFIEGHNAANLYLKGSPEVKRNHLQNLLSNITIQDQKVVSYQFKSVFQLLANAPKNGDFNTMLAAWDDIRKSLITSYEAPVIDIRMKLRETG